MVWEKGAKGELNRGSFQGPFSLEALVCNRDNFGLMTSHLYNVRGGEWFALSSSGALLAAMQKLDRSQGLQKFQPLRGKCCILQVNTGSESP